MSTLDQSPDFQRIEAENLPRGPKMMAQTLLTMQEIIRSSGNNESFIDWDIEQIIRVAKAMAIPPMT